jgi:hypothetical protein
MSDFWQFILAVFWRWQGWLGGSGFGGAIVVLVSLYERLSGRAMSKRMYVTFFVIAFLFGAFFMAWRDQLHAAIEANKKLDEEKPKFVLDINATLEGDVPEIGGATMFINLVLKNFGSPSPAYGWKLSVTAPSISLDRAAPTLIPDGFEVRRGSGKVIARFHQNNRLEEKALIPIQRNTFVSGWLRFSFPGVKAEQLKEGSVKTIYVRDILEHEYSASFTRLDANGVTYYPGSGDNPFIGAPVP